MEPDKSKNEISPEQMLIPEIVYPECLKKALFQIAGRLKEALERDGMPHGKEGLKIGRLPPHQHLAQIYFFWINEINDVIGNLNLVLQDFGVLGQRMQLFEGNPRTRFYLLTRTYFHEFYRIREIFNAAVRVLAIEGFISRDEIKPIRKDFHKAFEHTMNLRNTLVHGYANWYGEDHDRLSLTAMAEKRGFGVANQDTGEKVSMQNALHGMCDRFSGTLSEDGKRMSDFLQIFIVASAELMAKNFADLDV